MATINTVKNYLLIQIEEIENKLKEAEKRRKKHLFLDDINRLKHYTEIFDFINNLP
jgi:hypothetical protein